MARRRHVRGAVARVSFALGAALSMAALTLCAPARAQETTHGGVPVDHPVDLTTKSSDDLVDPNASRSWAEGKPRIFAATTIDAGYLYMRPRGMVGWGKPFANWIGFEANPIFAFAGLGGYGGARVAYRFFDLRVGVRHFGAFQHAFLEPQRSFNRLELDRLDYPKSRYTTFESELNLAFPFGPGDILGTGSVSYVAGVRENSYVFEETLRVIVDPPLVWRARGGYVVRFGSHDQHSAGPVVDILAIPKRDDSITVRAGPVLRFQLSRHFDIRGSFVMTISSPDRLGLVGGDFTELGVRYRTATE